MKTRLVLGLVLLAFLALFWFVTGNRPAAAQDAPAPDAPVQNTSSQDTSARDTPARDTPAQKVAVQATAVQPDMPQDSHAADPSLQDTQPQAPKLSSFEIAARSSGTPDFPGLNIVWLTPWGNREDANIWHNVVVHQSEGPAGSAYANAKAQAARPGKRGASIWVETDGTVYWATGEWATPSHVRDGNRNDNRYISNTDTYHLVPNNDTLGIEFVGNYPNVRKPPTEAQIDAWRILVRILQVRYGIPTDRIFAHNWIDYKDRRYCEGCLLASIARKASSEVALQDVPAPKPAP